jgi:hypothetical protein
MKVAMAGLRMIRQDLPARLIADEAARDDHAKQIRQLLTTDLWYRNAQAWSVAA